MLFNRFYQPDFNPETFETTPNALLSTSVEMRLPLRWIAMLDAVAAVVTKLVEQRKAMHEQMQKMMSANEKDAMGMCR